MLYPAACLLGSVCAWWFARSGAAVRSDRRSVSGLGLRAWSEVLGAKVYVVLPVPLRDALSVRAAQAGELSAYRAAGHKALSALVLTRGASASAVCFVVLALFSAWNVPDLSLVSRGRKRQDEIRRTLADVTDQVAVCMQAGLGFDAALAKVATVGSGPLTAELSRVLHDASLGMPRSEAFSRMLERTDVAELRQLVAAVNQADRYGTSVAETLRVQSAELRDRRRQWAEEQATKVPVKLLFPLMFCIMPALFIVLLGPAAIRISSSGFGG